MTEHMSRLKALSHPLRLQVLVHLDALREARTSDLAEALSVGANKISYHLTILEKGGFITKRTGEDARETWWSINEEKLNPPQPDPAERGTEDGRAASLAILEYIRSLVPDVMDGNQDQSVILTVAYLTETQKAEVVADLLQLLERVRVLSAENHERGEGALYALGAQLLPARAEQG